MSIKYLKVRIRRFFCFKDIKVIKNKKNQALIISAPKLLNLSSIS